MATPKRHRLRAYITSLVTLLVAQFSMRRISKDTWEQIKAGYAAGIGLREIVHKMNVAEGTVLARHSDSRL